MPDVRRLGREHVVEEPAAAELTEKAAETLEARRLRLRLLLEAAQDGRDQRRRTRARLPLVDTQLARHRLDAAHLVQDVDDLH